MIPKAFFVFFAFCATASGELMTFKTCLGKYLKHIFWKPLHEKLVLRLLEFICLQKKWKCSDSIHEIVFSFAACSYVRSIQTLVYALPVELKHLGIKEEATQKSIRCIKYQNARTCLSKLRWWVLSLEETKHTVTCAM